MTKVGTVKRIVRVPDDKYTIWVSVYYSESEDTFHRALPDFLVPYKHYAAGTIEDALTDNPDLDVCTLPSDVQRGRWKKLAYDFLRRKSEQKHSDSSDSLHPSWLHEIVRIDICDKVDIADVIQRAPPKSRIPLIRICISKYQANDFDSI